jgi:hypothetical protein
MKRGETSNVFLAPFVFEKSLKVACASRLHCYLLTIFSCHRGVGCGLGVTLGVGVAVGGGVSVSVGVTVGVTVGGVGVIRRRRWSRCWCDGRSYRRCRCSWRGRRGTRNRCAANNTHRVNAPTFVGPTRVAGHPPAQFADCGKSNW